jgi:hypothetical protein
MSEHPGAKMGPWEIRPIQDMTDIIRDSAQRRAVSSPSLRLAGP